MKPKHVVIHGGSVERWELKNRKLHREDGPALIMRKEGKIVEEWWQLYGKFHREDGPAYIKFKDGEITRKQWFANGKRLRKEDFTSIEMIDRMKAYSLFTPIEIAKMKKNET